MIKDQIQSINSNSDLSYQEMESAINSIMSGNESDGDIEEFLLALNTKGISEIEISAAASVMRSKSLQFDIGDGNHIDTCGTGGSGLHTFNCSTASAFVATAGGAKVTKHGNKAISSKSGSADFLTTAGANINHERDQLNKIFNNVGFIFLFAPLHHQSMKYVMPARQKIGVKTIFNLLGPHTNPCNAKKQIIGVYSKDLVEVFASVAKKLGMEHVLVVHGADGLDEITITEKTYVAELKDGDIKKFEIIPEDFGLHRALFEQIEANSPEESYQMIIDAFSGNESPVTDMIAMNAGAAIYLAGCEDSIEEGVYKAKNVLKNGSAKNALEQYVKFSNLK